MRRIDFSRYSITLTKKDQEALKLPVYDQPVHDCARGVTCIRLEERGPRVRLADNFGKIITISNKRVRLTERKANPARRRRKSHKVRDAIKAIAFMQGLELRV